MMVLTLAALALFLAIASIVMVIGKGIPAGREGHCP
jgi:hypothetical protein